MRLAADRDLPLLHRLEQRALHLRGSAVDLVGKDEVREHRAERDLELAELLVEDPRAHDVRRNEVRRELDALELPADRLCQRLHRHRLRKPGNAFHEQMPPRQKGDDHPLEKRILADDHALDLVQDLFEGRIECGLCVHGSSRHLGGAFGAAGADRHGEADAGEVPVTRRVGEAGDDPDHLTAAVEQRPARAPRIDGRIELDEPAQRPSARRLDARSRPEITPDDSEPTKPRGWPTAYVSSPT